MQTEQIPQLIAGEYPGGTWYYEPHTYQPYRYVLGRVGSHPLVCIGINPSTAQPGALDPTLKSVERLAAANGFDSWIMFNVYPQRATDPNDMDRVPDRALCDENLRWLRAVLAQTEPTMWAAWGTLIEKRDYLPGLMREMVALTGSAISRGSALAGAAKRAIPTTRCTCARIPLRSPLMWKTIWIPAFNQS